MTADGSGRVARVLLTADTAGGVWTFAVELCRALTGANVDVVLAALGPPLTGDHRRDLAGIESLTLHECTCALEWMAHPWADVDRSGRWLLDLERLTAPDVVHLGSYSHGALPWRAPVVITAHSCVLSWWTAVHGRPAPASYETYRRRVRAGLAGASLVTAPSAAMLSDVQRLYGPLARAAVVGNARTPEAFVPGPKQPIVFGAGRVWDAGKNLAALDRAAAELPWPVLIAGSTTSPDGHSVPLRHARALGVLSSEAMRDVMAAASIYALPARYEPFGLSALEAGLAGAALVLGDIPSLHEIWGDAAVFVDPDDDAGLVRAIRRLIDDPAARDERARRARARALQWTPARMRGAYLALYEAARTARVA